MNAYGGPLNVIIQSPVSRTNHFLPLDKLHQLRRENKRLTCQHHAVQFPLPGKTHSLLQVCSTDIGLCRIAGVGKEDDGPTGLLAGLARCRFRG